MLQTKTTGMKRRRQTPGAGGLQSKKKQINRRILLKKWLEEEEVCTEFGACVGAFSELLPGSVSEARQGDLSLREGNLGSFASSPSPLACEASLEADLLLQHIQKYIGPLPASAEGFSTGLFGRLGKFLVPDQCISGQPLGSGTFGDVYIHDRKAHKLFKRDGEEIGIYLKYFVRSVMIFIELELFREKEKKDLLPKLYGISYAFCGDEVKVGICMEHYGDNLKKYCTNKEISNITSRQELLRTVSSIVRQLANGLDFLQVKGVFPRDLKLENLLIKNGVVKFCDLEHWLLLTSGFTCTARQGIDECTTPLNAPQEQFYNQKRLDVFWEENIVGEKRPKWIRSHHIVLWTDFRKNIITNGFLVDPDSYLKNKACSVADYWGYVNRHAMMFCFLDATCHLFNSFYSEQKLPQQSVVPNKLLNAGLFSFGDPTKRPAIQDGCNRVIDIINEECSQQPLTLG